MLQARTETTQSLRWAQMACASAYDWDSGSAVADHAFRRSAMPLKTNGYDAERACKDGRGDSAWASIRSNDKSKTSAFGEDIMKHWLIGLMLLIGPPALAQQAVPSIAFDSVPNPLRLPPNMYLGEVSGVSVNSKGHIFVLSRGNTTGPCLLYT